MKFIKLYELYRTDRSQIFNTDVVKKPNRQFIIDLFQDISAGHKTTDEDFNINYVLSYLKSLDIKDIESSNFEIVIVPNNQYHHCDAKSYNIKFKTNPEDLSWGGIYPPILDLEWNIVFTALQDEYYIIHYNILRPVTTRLHDFSGGKVSYRIGDLWIDGQENLLPAIKNMIENYDQL